MSKFATFPAAVILGFLAGCGPSTPQAGVSPPHGGTFVAIPGGAGTVEVVKKPSTAATAPIDEEVSFYFFKVGDTPYSPAPTSGSLTLVDNKKVDLVVKGDALVTPSGPPLFPKGDVEGILSVDLGGKATSIRLGGR